ncbi:MAG: hypothetical protein WCX61_01405 [Candidatus Peribacteraceae bacterium]
MDTLLVLLAGVTAWVAYKEFVLKRRPYVVPEIAFKKTGEDEEEKWFFNAILVNKGTYPGMARISKASLKIGDEEHPTNFHQELILVPSERQLLAQLGHINAKGLRKIRGHEYQINRVEINLEIESKSINDKDYHYKTTYDFSVDVSGDEPSFSPIKQHIE